MYALSFRHGLVFKYDLNNILTYILLILTLIHFNHHEIFKSIV